MYFYVRNIILFYVNVLFAITFDEEKTDESKISVSALSQKTNDIILGD